MAVTLRDIARIAQVSESAVSRALHDNPRISEATRNKVKKIARDLEFDFNFHAQSLSTKKSKTVGVIIPNFGAKANNSYYLDLLINNIRSQLAARGYDILLAESPSSNSNQSNVRRLALQKKVDGLILIIAKLQNEDRDLLNKRKIPVVLVNSKPKLMIDQSIDVFPYFFTDNLAGGCLAAQTLIGRNCSRLLCLADSDTIPEMVDRTTGFIQAASERGFTVQTKTITSIFTVAHKFTASNKSFFQSGDGIFCHTDIMACAVLKGLQEHGFAIPQDIKLIGYDNIELGTYFSPRITTIHQPRETIAQKASEYLVKMMNSPNERLQVPHIHVEPELILREST